VSRRRKAGPPGRLAATPVPTRKRLAPADLAVFIDVRCPGGHRLVRFGRMLADPDHLNDFYDRPGPGVVFLAEHFGELDWGVLTFGCKACRDRGLAQWSQVTSWRIHVAVAGLWEQVQAQGDGVPRAGHITTTICRDTV
jgi:hypothetical protein